MEKSKTLNPQEVTRKNLKAIIYRGYDAMSFGISIITYCIIYYSLTASIIYFYNINLPYISLLGINLFKLIIIFAIFGLILFGLKLVIVSAEKQREINQKRRLEFKEQLTKEILGKINGRRKER
jgi:uncharacterized Tic20 family protein